MIVVDDQMRMDFVTPREFAVLSGLSIVQIRNRIQRNWTEGREYTKLDGAVMINLREIETRWQERKPSIRPRWNRIEINYRDADGKRHFFSIKKKPTKTNLDWVARQIDDLIEQHQLGSDLNSSTFASYAQDYLNGAEIALSTRNSYRDSLNIYWIPTLANRNIMQITCRKLRQIDESTDWPGAKTRKNAITALRGVFSLAYDDNSIPAASSPARNLKFKKHQKAAPDPFTLDERNKILAWFDDDKNKVAPSTRLYFLTAFGTGMRSGELIALQWQDFDGEQLQVCRSRVRSEIKATKTDEPRVVILPGLVA